MYRNWIFDLYGTLIDIRTNEEKHMLWRRMAELYSCTGAPYTAKELKEAYHRIAIEEEEDLRSATGVSLPEIELRRVFKRLFDEATGNSKLKEVFDAWIDDAANVFRILSRERFRVYPGVHDTLDRLRSEGKRIFLLSNAQAVFTETELRLAGLSDRFDGIRLSSDYGMKKPYPEFMLGLIREYSLYPKETVMVGNDVMSDMAIADACGIDGILLNTDGRTPAKIADLVKQSGIKREIRTILSGKIEEIE